MEISFLKKSLELGYSNRKQIKTLLICVCLKELTILFSVPENLVGSDNRMSIQKRRNKTVIRKSVKIQS